MNDSRKRIIITGGHGYVGSRLREFWHKSGYEVFLLSEKQKGTYLPNENWIEGGTEKPNFPKRIDALVHLYGLSGDAACEKYPELAKKMNVDFTRKVVSWTLQESFPQVIFASTLSIYDEGLIPDAPLYAIDSPTRPKALYGKTKLEAESLLKTLAPATSVTVLRKPAIYGISNAMRYDTLIHYLLREAYIKGEIPLFNDGEIFRPTLSMSHALFAYDQVLGLPQSGFQILNCVTENQKVSVYGERIQRLAASYGKNTIFHSIRRPDAASYRVKSSLTFPSGDESETAFIQECRPIWQKLKTEA